MTAEQQLESGLSHHQAGRLAQAERIYRQVLAQHPDHADALHLLGVLAVQAGRLDAGVELMRRAIRLKPELAEAHNNLGNALKEMGQLDEAIAVFRQAIRIKPDFAQAYNNLGNALNDKGQSDEAIASYWQAIRLKPGYSEAHSNLGNALKDKGQLEEAIDACRQAIRLQPELAEAHNNLGNALTDKGQLDEAIAAYRQAVRLKPDFADAHSNLGTALNENGQFEEAVASHRQAIRLKPDFAAAHSNLGNALRDARRLDEAIASYRQAIRLKPDYAEAHNNLGTALKDVGQLDEAVACFRRAIQLRPDDLRAHSNLVLTLLYHPGYDGGMIHEELGRWSQRHAEPLKKLIQPHVNNRDPQRRLRIGYVSTDFRGHAVAYLLLPLLRHHDSRQCDVTCYSNVPHPDAISKQMQDQVPHWRDVVRLTDTQVAAQVREDEIDILVDLGLHTADNRLLVFARKPAPVQATWMLPTTTGLDAIDYRLTDPYMDPPGLNDAHYSERSIYLPDTFWCYDPLGGEPAVNEPPSLEKGYVTFGCLNNFCKVNDAVLSLWAGVLNTVSNSRLALLAPEGSSRRRVLDRLGREGIGPERVEFVPRQPRLRYLQSYHCIDIGLDTFPYCGHTTSFDSHWMGVPVVTLVGKTAVGRSGLSQLTNLGLPELIAQTPEQYVQIAAALAGDLPRLAELRRTLRARMEASPLMDAPRFARNVEAAYRQMWRSLCERGEAS
jgi:predicted O-linked N-acetylglucosamine transferase (SPINDLY family)